MDIDVENLGADQISAMGPAQVLAALDACIDATCEIGRESTTAETTLAAIEINWHLGKYESRSAFLAEQRAAKRDCKVLFIRERTIKRIQSAIQSRLKLI